MLFSTLGVVIAAATDAEFERIEEWCLPLIDQVENIGYSVEVIKSLCEETYKASLTEALRQKDVVVTWGRFKNPRGYLYEIVAQIFREPLSRNEKLANYLQAKAIDHQPKDVDLPKNSKFLHSDGKTFPIVQVHRLFVFDEDIFAFSAHVSSLIHRLETYRRPPTFSKSYSIEPADGVKDYIKNLMKFKNGMKIEFSANSPTYLLSTIAPEIEDLNLIQIDLNKNLNEMITRVEFTDKQQESLMTSDEEHIVCALNCIRQCFAMYGPENVFISFNGGKDCTVLLHMMLIVLNREYPNHQEPPVCMYVKSENPFSQVDDFIDSVKDCYNLNIVTITSEIREALESILNEKPNLKACLMGTRRMDPFSEHLEHFKMTDNGWPPVMRVSPLLDWDYGNIWDYLIDFKVPYCCLYDNGYTSLGNTNNTVKNPDLLSEDAVYHQKFYLPAYKLFDGSKERLGRL